MLGLLLVLLRGFRSALRSRADLMLENLALRQLRANGKDHWTWRWAAPLTGCYDRLRVPPDVDGWRDRRDRLAEAWRLEGGEV